MLSLATEKLVAAFRVNFLGAFWTCRAFVPAMIGAGYGRIVNVSSGYARSPRDFEGPPAYSLSKAALNAFTFKLVRELPGHVKVNAMCPGWVRTRMGGPDARGRWSKPRIRWCAWRPFPMTGPLAANFRDRHPIS